MDLATSLFWIAASAMVLAEVYFLLIDVVGKNAVPHIVTVIRHFRSGRYYKPWKSNKLIVIAPNRKEMTELSEAPVLSQRAVYADMFGFQHTMNKLAHNEHKIVRTRLYGRLLQVNGPRNLAALFPALQRRLTDSIGKELQTGRISNGAIAVPIARTSRRLASRLMSLIFFGEKASSDPAFAEALLRYSRDMVSCMVAFQVTPSFLSPIAHAILTRRGQAMRVIQDRLISILADSWVQSPELRQHTVLHNMAQLAESNQDYWTPQVISQSMLGIWFAASHQPWMNLDFVLLELCARPEWQAVLREEIGDYATLDYGRLEKLPLLDSFIKETVRLNPLDTMAIRRKALSDYTFSGGAPFVPAGSTVCVSSYDVLHDQHTYPRPNEFDGRRFAVVRESSRFTDVSEHFPIWGFGSLACPGRFHASLVMKMVVAHLVSRFDLRLENETARRKWSWETFTMPYESTRVLLTRRELLTS